MCKLAEFDRRMLSPSKPYIQLRTIIQRAIASPSLINCGFTVLVIISFIGMIEFLVLKSEYHVCDFFYVGPVMILPFSNSLLVFSTENYV